MNSLDDIISEEALRSRLACKRLIQYMYQHDLKEGSQLPPQEALRVRFKFGHATLSRAMRSMSEHGLVSRRQRTGTRVVDRNATIPDLWTVALPIYSIGDQDDLYINTLVRLVEAELHEAGCAWRTYMRTRTSGQESSALSHFGGMDSDLRRHRIDALLFPTNIHPSDLTQVKERGIPVCGLFSREPVGCGVGIEQRQTVRRMVDELCAAGCRSIAITGHDTLIRPQHLAMRQAFAESTQTLVADGGKAELVISPDTATRQTGRQLGRSLLNRPASQRPDGLIVFSDVVAVGLTEMIAAGDYRPRLVVQTNKQVPLAFALPVVCYELDVAELARVGVEMILQRMRDPSVPDKTKVVVPRRAEPISAAIAGNQLSIETVQVLDPCLLTC